MKDFRNKRNFRKIDKVVLCIIISFGEVAERMNAPVLKTGSLR